MDVGGFFTTHLKNMAQPCQIGPNLTIGLNINKYLSCHHLGDTVDGRNPAFTSRGKVVYAIIYDRFYTSQVVQDFWNINSRHSMTITRNMNTQKQSNYQKSVNIYLVVFRLWRSRHFLKTIKSAERESPCLVHGSEVLIFERASIHDEYPWNKLSWYTPQV